MSQNGANTAADSPGGIQRPLAGTPRADKVRRMYRDLSAASLGLEMGLAVVIGWALGHWVDGKWGTAPLFMIIGLAMGAAAGFKGVFRAAKQAKQVLAESNESESVASSTEQ